MSRSLGFKLGAITLLILLLMIPLLMGSLLALGFIRLWYRA